MEPATDVDIAQLKSEITELRSLLAKKDEQLEVALDAVESNLLSMHVAVKEAVECLHDSGRYVPAASLSLVVDNFGEQLSDLKRSRGARSLQVVAEQDRQELPEGRLPGKEVAHETSGGHVHRQGDRRGEDLGVVRGDQVRATDGQCRPDDVTIPTNHVVFNHHSSSNWRRCHPVVKSSLIELYIALGLVEAM
jgi:hypothetical protein